MTRSFGRAGAFVRIGGAWLWVGAAAAAGAVLVAALPDAARVWIDWRPARFPAEPWRVVSAAWVHWSAGHLAANLLGTALVAALGIVAGCGRRAASAWALAWPLTQALLAPWPELARYGGLSGVLHAGTAVAALHLLRHDSGARRGVGAALLAGLGLKIWLEAPWGPPLRALPGWDIPIAPLAHATGVAAGLLCAAALDAPRSIGR